MEYNPFSWPHNKLNGKSERCISLLPWSVQLDISAESRAFEVDSDFVLINVTPLTAFQKQRKCIWFALSTQLKNFP